MFLFVMKFIYMVFVFYSFDSMMKVMIFMLVDFFVSKFFFLIGVFSVNLIKMILVLMLDFFLVIGFFYFLNVYFYKEY